MNERNERIPEEIIQLKNENNIYIYGVGEYTQRCIDVIDKYRIKIKGILVSTGYKFQDTFSSYQIEEFEDQKQLSIVIGFNFYRNRKLFNELLGNEFIDHIYVFDRYGFFLDEIAKNSKIICIDDYFERMLSRNLTREYYSENMEAFQQTRSYLFDEKSKRIFDLFIEGHMNAKSFPLREEWSSYYQENQYFLDELFCLRNNEVFVDCGAYSGDTIIDFCKRVEDFTSYYALEPDKRVINQLTNTIQANKNNNKIIHLEYGAWNERAQLRFFEDTCGTICDENTGISIEVDKIDKLIPKEEKVSFIKMDIEGSEYNALLGATDTIQRNKPILAICVYHKKEDLITIPQFIHSLYPEYRLFLRSHRLYAGELVLYAISKERNQ